MRKIYFYLATLLCSVSALNGYTQSLLPAQIWTDINPEMSAIKPTAKMQNITQYRLMKLNIDLLGTWLQTVPMEFTAEAKAQPTTITLPLPDNTFEQFTIVESPTMEPALANKYPTIKTYSAQGIRDKSMWAKLDFTPLGFHAMISTPQGMIMIDPVSIKNTEEYIVYNKLAVKTKPNTYCEKSKNTDKKKEESTIQSELPSFPKTAASTVIELRKYRLALAATGEYTKTKGGTVEGGLAGEVISLNRVNGIYESEASIRLVLIANNDKLIFTDPQSDPYTNNDGRTMLGENQQTIDKIIGKANYDMGHVFSTGGGGVASLGSICSNIKAQGVTGLPDPTGDDFDVDFVVHEMGHQFGGNHTFNSQSGNCGGGTRASAAAYEPGSGITIMAYAGICSVDDLAPHSIAYFHAKSLEEIYNFSRKNGGNNCPQHITTGNHTPDVKADVVHTIPKSTPFAITGSGSDIDGDALTYSWEQYNLGAVANKVGVQTGNNPILRTYAPSNSPTRIFPRLNDLLNSKHTFGEDLPTLKRKLFFRLTARDNQLGAGATAYDTVSIFVTDSAGPFKITSQTSTQTWTGGDKQAITWDVMNTDKAPLNCDKVDVLLSLDGGYTFPITIVAGTANDGLDSIIVPAVNTSKGRIKVQASANIFFDINRSNINISSPGFQLKAPSSMQYICSPDSITYYVQLDQIAGYTGRAGFQVSNVPTGALVTLNRDSVTIPGSLFVKISNLAAVAEGTYSISIKANTSDKSDSSLLNITVFKGIPQAVSLNLPADKATNQIFRPLFNWAPVSNVLTYEIQISKDSTFNIIDFTDNTITNSTYILSAINLTPLTKYFWRVRPVNTCGKGAYSTVYSFNTRAASPKAPVLSGSVVQDTLVKLTWVDNATNEDGFIIKRSLSSATNFITLDTVIANTTQYTDSSVLKGGKYYYEVSAYNSGGYAVSNTVNFSISGVDNLGIQSSGLTVYPNPTNQWINIAINTPAHGAYSINLYDLTGRLVKTSTVVKTGEQSITPFNMAELNKGLYILKVTLPNGTVITQKVTLL